MPRLPRILVATPCAETLDALRVLLAGDASLVEASDLDGAVSLLGSRSIDGLVADTRIGGPSARRLADAFLRAREHPDTLLRLDIRSPRLQVIFRPWHDWELRTYLVGTPFEATGTA